MDNSPERRGNEEGAGADGAPDADAPTIHSEAEATVRSEKTITQFVTEKGAPDAGVSLPDELDGRIASAVLKGGEQDRYHIGETVAKGGMGAILIAKDLNIRRHVAMKVMLNAERAPVDGVLRFIEEAQVTGQLEHPGIVPVYELGIDADDQPFYSMKYVRGVTLDQVLLRIAAGDAETIAAYPLSRLLSVFQRICEAMAYAHHRGVVHRDLKPENIMIGGFGEVLVMDWGLAKVLGAKTESMAETGGEDTIDSLRSDTRAGDGLRTMDGVVMGTPKFMAPEQAMGNVSDVNPRTDVYSLGAILYNILTLRPPVAGTTLDEILEAVAQGKIARPDALDAKATALPHCGGGAIPSSLSAVAMKALALDPAERYASAEELRAEIDAYMAGFATAAEAAGLYRQLCLLVRRHKKEFMLLGTAALVLVTVVSAFMVKVSVEKRRAVTSEQKARSSEQKAVRARGEAELARTDAELENYVSTITLALEQIKKGNITDAKRLLDGCPPRLRHWEWGFVHDLWERAEGTFVRTGGNITMAEADPKGRGVLISTRRCAVGLVSPDASRLTPLWEGEDKNTTGGAVRPDGGAVAIAYRDGVIPLIDLERNTRMGELRFPPPHSYNFAGLAWQPGDDGYIAGIFENNEHIYLWRPGTAEPAHILTPQHAPLTVAFNPATRRLLTTWVGGDPRAAYWEEWDCETLTPIRQKRCHTRRIRRTRYAPSGKYMLTCSDDATARVWDVESGLMLWMLTADETAVWDGIFSPNERFMVTGSRDGQLRMWDFTDGRHVRAWQASGVEALAFTDQGKCLVAASRECSLRSWRVVDAWCGSFDHTALTKERGLTEDIQISPDGHYLLTSNAYWVRGIDLYDLRTATYLGAFLDSSAQFLDAGLWAEQTRIAAACSDGKVRMWPIDKVNDMTVLKGHAAEATALYVLPDSSRFCTVGNDGRVLLWEPEKTHEPTVIVHEPDRKWHVSAISRKGDWLVACSVGGRPDTLCCWSLPSGELRWRQDWSCVYAMDVSHDNQWIACSRSADGAIALVNAATGAESLRLSGSTSMPRALAFTSDDSRIISAAEEEINVWLVQRQRRILTISLPGGAFKSLALTPDDHTLFAGGGNRRLLAYQCSEWTSADETTATAP